jgi:hypothetical protein
MSTKVVKKNNVIKTDAEKPVIKKTVIKTDAEKPVIKKTVIKTDAEQPVIKKNIDPVKKTPVQKQPNDTILKTDTPVLIIKPVIKKALIAKQSLVDNDEEKKTGTESVLKKTVVKKSTTVPVITKEAPVVNVPITKKTVKAKTEVVAVKNTSIPLSKNFLKKLLDDTTEWVPFTIQITGIKKKNDRYRATIWDGGIKASAILASQLTHLVEEGKLKTNDIVRANHYACTAIDDSRKIIIFTDIDIL